MKYFYLKKINRNIIKDIKKWNALPLDQAYNLNPERNIKLNTIRLDKLVKVDYFPTIMVDEIKV